MKLENLYSYAKDNPLNMVDLNGTQANPWTLYTRYRQLAQATEEAANTAVDVGLGLAEGLWDLAKGAVKGAIRRSDLSRGRIDEETLTSWAETYKREGFWGGLYTLANEEFNPAYQSMVSWYETKQAIDAGDIRQAARNTVGAVAATASTVAVAVGGAKLLTRTPSAPVAKTTHGVKPPKVAGGVAPPASVAAPPPGRATFGNLFPGDIQPGGKAPIVRLVQEKGRWYEIGPKGVRRSARGNYDFIVIDGEVRAVRSSRVLGGGRAGHTTLSGGARVDYAGQVRFGGSSSSRGVVRGSSNASGHYAPASAFAEKANPFYSKETFKPVKALASPGWPGPQLPVFQPGRH